MEVTSALWRFVILGYLYTASVQGQSSSGNNPPELQYGHVDKMEAFITGGVPAAVGIAGNGVPLSDLASGYAEAPYHSLSFGVAPPSFPLEYSFPRFPMLQSLVSAVKGVIRFLLGVLQLTDVDRYSSLRQAADSLNFSVDRVLQHVNNINRTVFQLFSVFEQVPILGFFVQLAVKMFRMAIYVPKEIIKLAMSFVKRLIDGQQQRYAVPQLMPYYG